MNIWKKKTKQTNQPKLQFLQAGDNCGFMTSALANYGDAESNRIVRELIQNSLDAVRETGRNDAIIRFELGQVKKSEIPEIKKYEDVFKNAVKAQTDSSNGQLIGQHKIVIEAIKKSLALDKIDVLYILDNGTGLDKKHMEKLLSDGASGKSSGNSGSFGVGHLTAIPASDLRYVFYGGVSKKDGAIAAGHCILASFTDDDRKRMGSNGYYAKKYSIDFFEPFEFAKSDEIPCLIKTKTDWIQEGGFTSKTGSAVIIPAFNFFREDIDENSIGKLWEVIKKASATNFFAAIHNRELTIEFKANEIEEKLDYKNIEEVLNNLSLEKRSKYISGSLAYEAFTTICKGKNIDIKFDSENVNLRLLKTGRMGSKRIHLCRNGMWITKELPSLQTGSFGEYENFNAVILLDKSQSKIHELVRDAEGPEHKEVDPKFLASDVVRKRELIRLMKAIQMGIKNELTKHDKNQFVSDFWNIEGSLSGGNSGSSKGLNGDWQEVRPRPSAPSGIGIQPGQRSGGGNSGEGKSLKPMVGKSIPFQAIPVMKSPRHCTVEIIPQGKIAEGEIRFILDESHDQSCDLKSDEFYVQLSEISLDGNAISDSELVHVDNTVLGIRLKNLDQSKRQILDFKFDFPQNSLKIKKDQPVALKIQIYKFTKSNQEI